MYIESHHRSAESKAVTLSTSPLTRKLTTTNYRNLKWGLGLLLWRELEIFSTSLLSYVVVNVVIRLWLTQLNCRDKTVNLLGVNERHALTEWKPIQGSLMIPHKAEQGFDCEYSRKHHACSCGERFDCEYSRKHYACSYGEKRDLFIYFSIIVL